MAKGKIARKSDLLEANHAGEKGPNFERADPEHDTGAGQNAGADADERRAGAAGRGFRLGGAAALFYAPASGASGGAGASSDRQALYDRPGAAGELGSGGTEAGEDAYAEGV